VEEYEEVLVTKWTSTGRWYVPVLVRLL